MEKLPPEDNCPSNWHGPFPYTRVRYGMYLVILTSHLAAQLSCSRIVPDHWTHASREIVVSFPNPKATSAWALACLVSFPDPQQDSQYHTKGVGMRLYRVILEVI